MKTKLYIWEKQKESPYPTGFEVLEHLKQTKLIDQCLSLKDEIVKDWLENPETYPEEYKSEWVYLWKSTRAAGSSRDVACLYWRDGRVFVDWDWLESGWRGDDPALLASSSNKITKVSKVKEIPERIEYKGQIYKLSTQGE